MKSWLQSIGVLLLMCAMFIIGICVDSWMPKSDKDLKRAIERTLWFDRDVAACVSNVQVHCKDRRHAELYVMGDDEFEWFRCSDTVDSNLFGVVLDTMTAYFLYLDTYDDAFGVIRVAQQTNGSFLISLSTGTKRHGIRRWNGQGGHREKYFDLRHVTVEDGRRYVVSQLWDVSTFTVDN